MPGGGGKNGLQMGCSTPGVISIMPGGGGGGSGYRFVATCGIIDCDEKGSDCILTCGTCICMDDVSGTSRPDCCEESDAEYKFQKSE